ncbi:MAG: helix-turn-helix domain-containing protein [Rikenellaceae bacterium]
MLTRANYITGRTSEFEEFRQSVPLLLEAGGFLICTSGSGDVVVDSKQYRVGQWDMLVAFPHSYAHAIHTSDDFDGVLFGVDMDMLISVDISNRSFYIASVFENPCISLREEEAHKILALRESFLKESANVDHPFREQIDEAIIKILIYEIAVLFRHSKPNVEYERSRDDVIFNNFIVQLYSQEPHNRDLEYFAHRQSITPSHLSRVVKRVSNRTASQWISGYTIVSIKRLLQNKELSIGSIADRLNFANASFMSQYFKKQTQQTPKAYRMEIFGDVSAVRR